MGKSICLSEADELQILDLAKLNTKVYVIARLTHHSPKCVKAIIARKRSRTDAERFEIHRPDPSPEEIQLLASIERVRHLEKLIDHGKRKSPVKLEIALQSCFIEEIEE